MEEWVAVDGGGGVLAVEEKVEACLVKWMKGERNVG